jgi:hypothetical protein
MFAIWEQEKIAAENRNSPITGRALTAALSSGAAAKFDISEVDLRLAQSDECPDVFSGGDARKYRRSWRSPMAKNMLDSAQVINPVLQEKR